MNPIETRPLPNAADKAALKAIATRVVTACPSLQDTAHEVASNLLDKFGIVGHDPDKIYFHRFKYSSTNPEAFTGWEHCCAKPLESMTLTQLVIHRFRVGDQDNADMLDVDAGFYTAGPEADEFNHTNEIRLHGDKVLREFWNINFSDVYRNKLQAFWDDYADDFRTLAKCNFLSKAVEARDSGLLTDDDFQTVVSAVIGTLTWPVSLATLQAESPAGQELQVATLSVDGHEATNILRISDAKGRQILYVPGDTPAFHVLETATDMHWWVLQKMNEKAPRTQFLEHFSLADRHQMTENISDLMNRLVSTWGHCDHHLINHNTQTVTEDAFSWLRHSTRTAMLAEADLSLTSNGDLREKLWIGYLSAGLKVFGPMAAVGWPVALPVIGATLANMGLNIDQAVNGKTAAERKEGVLGAILSGIDALFNLPFLKGVGSMAEVGAEAEAAEAAEWAKYSEATQEPGESVPQEMEEVSPPAGETISAPHESSQASEIKQSFESNELLDGQTPVSEPGKYQGIYRLNSDPPFAILMNDTAYYVRYFADSQGGGFWAIVDPARPNQLIHSIPVRLNAEGLWERMTRLGLRGGGQCLGKECTVELELDVRNPPTAETAPPVVEPEPTVTAPQPSTSTGIRPIRTLYDVEAGQRARLRKWAMQLPETHLHVQIGPDGELIAADRYALHCAEKARTLLMSARRFYANLPWANLPPRPALPVVNASTTVPQLLAQIFESAPGLVVSETPGRITSMRFMIQNMATLARQGVKTLYVRRLLNDFAQIDLNAYFKSGVMTEDLEKYLTRLGTDPSGRFNELELVKTARQNGIRVQATDCAATYRKPVSHTRIEEQISTNHLTSDIMFMDNVSNDVGKWVALTGVENTNTFRGFAGISELEGGIGLRIEEVDPGQGERWTVDPGIEMEKGPSPEIGNMLGTVDTLHADLRLQMEAPPVMRNEQQISRLLTRPGMYVFEQSEGDYTMVHRSQNEMIVRTPVQVMADGHCYIDRPTWPSVNGVPYASLERLSNALDQMGMSLQSRLPG
ncbi:MULTISPECIES: membrane-targeted effector domain-containing toxin [Pseudomonas]|uniref:Membrane-targeted effector domain-containing toxin n=1 Tax=Pseudomonas aphyarum TaxID=2942629 RepID=A0ABT5PP28_9PSED|nr:membrane-targeted effector domain-containing toxin [Pseudomonas aphyarum]MDD0970390.1 membrane-targeted effector domain-containing toxin [Pseudomonas aphyarum]MDD1125445.1 membrane-targeted effector domain-containing toxin [Pseudomonas aphyarum]